MSALKEAMLQAGHKTPRQRLNEILDRCIAESPRNYEGACQAVARAIFVDTGAAMASWQLEWAIKELVREHGPHSARVRKDGGDGTALGVLENHDESVPPATVADPARESAASQYDRVPHVMSAGRAHDIFVDDKLDMHETPARAAGAGQISTDDQPTRAGTGSEISARPTPKPSTLTPKRIVDAADRFRNSIFGDYLVGGLPYWQATPRQHAMHADADVIDIRRRVKEVRFSRQIERMCPDKDLPVGEQLSAEQLRLAEQFAEKANALAV